MEQFYHAAPKEKVDSILDEGLEPSEANECECGVGIHVAENEYDARYWCDKLSAESVYAGTGDFRCVIIAVDVDEDADIRPDYYRGDFDAEGWVICRETPIPPSRLSIVGEHPKQPE